MGGSCVTHRRGRQVARAWARCPEKDGRQLTLQPPTAFSSTQPWDRAGNKVAADKGVRYMMSVIASCCSRPKVAPTQLRK